MRELAVVDPGGDVVDLDGVGEGHGHGVDPGEGVGRVVVGPLDVLNVGGELGNETEMPCLPRRADR